MSCRVLLTGFRCSSAEKLISGAHGCDTLLLPNDKQRDAELLAHQLANAQYDFIMCIGQRPNIKDKVHIETTARDNGVAIETAVDCPKLAELFGLHGISAKLSDNAGTSYCNSLYFNGLRFVVENSLDAGLVFVHIPYQKNMSSPCLFEKSFFKVIDQLVGKGVEDLWIK